MKRWSPTGQVPNTLVPLSSALMSCSRQHGDVVKQGYLGKMERTHRRYFVLRAGSHTGPSRLEWYKTQHKFTAREKTAGKTTLFGSSTQGVIYLRNCLGASRLANFRKGHIVVLYAKDQTMVLVVDDQQEQEAWYVAVKNLIEEEHQEEELDEEDDGYSTLPPAAVFKEVWSVTVKARGLGRTQCLAGESRLCLTASSLVLVKVGVVTRLPSVMLPLLSVRRFGHSDGLFFLELGRKAPTGPGEIWLEARDKGDPALGQHIHEVVWETVRAMRALPNFNWSPNSNHISQNQSQTLKRSRHKRHEKRVHATPCGSPLSCSHSCQSQTTSSPTQHHPESCGSEKSQAASLSSASNFSSCRSLPGSTPETGSYVDMKANLVTGRPEDSSSSMVGWEPGGEEEELGYVMMSPQVGLSSSGLCDEEYVTMANQHADCWPDNSPSSSSLQMSLNSTNSDGLSPPRPPHHHTSEDSDSDCLVPTVLQVVTEANQSQTAVCCSNVKDAARLEENTLPPGGTVGFCLLTPTVTNRTGRPRSIPTHPDSKTRPRRPVQAMPDQSAVKRSCPGSLFCLPSCVEPEYL
ncbi:insulin receptor substrate 2-B-like isoform X2 [Thalassophryne amazonica]|uniref:insulin receptor substrate 2-B-like isoform X2 n=1 Tax=Thalassophryne amazonica TaxID=390379 RepID=UPI0014710488|nr:insulin receptor substrate 2-B-like isoform X2 [Thalassophryne amazonica]